MSNRRITKLCISVIAAAATCLHISLFFAHSRLRYRDRVSDPAMVRCRCQCLWRLSLLASRVYGPAMINLSINPVTEQLPSSSFHYFGMNHNGRSGFQFCAWQHSPGRWLACTV
ncbi:hypothetical protein M408DRAFT_300572 [Serendipita vermifera MAFF 305830]|uniref:Uncharacterized protein n=1 Tax=Serendipita vermifera MAFF 305830 TaxID=933852 RepID=A0A0C2WWR2_SERVB|nr:hypothetical protein M408DRAFT_300572 [Serendipita vermifera MAFF 305830]